jgi:metal transporter CNNM
MTYIIVIILIAFSALFSGLTLGFFSLNKDDLERKVKLGDEKAKKVYKIREDGNLLLCTLLIGNVAVNSALSIFLGSIASGFMAGLIATALIVIFGEIIPQATFSRYALLLGSKLSWLVKTLIYILYPVTKPIAFVLDKVLGEEMPTIYSKHELIELIEDHEESKDSDLDNDEKKIIRGALLYGDKTVNDILTPRIQIFALKSEELISSKIIKKIYESGHSRIPVYKEDLDHIEGILYTKDLMANSLENKKASDVARKDVFFVDSHKHLDDLLKAFKETRHHLFIVLNKYGETRGIVTIEDVLEEIIGEEIVDEFDKVEDLQEEARRKLRGRKIRKV